MPYKEEITKNIKEKAISLGFNSCGIVPANTDSEHLNIFINWLKKSYNANLKYLENNVEIRANPKLLVENAKSVVVLLSSYNRQNSSISYNSIARYALSKDYHIVLKRKMYELLNYLKKNWDINGRCFVDSAPILERSYAYNAGLGFIGKNTCLINENLGSWVFISTLIVDKELCFDKQVKISNNNCISCNKCVEACPTGALKPYEIDCNLCISYHTIENRNIVPDNVKSKITNQFFGCDICQIVCPYNKNIKADVTTDLQEINLLKQLDISTFENMTNSMFKKEFKDTSLYRTGLKKLKENANNLKSKKT